MRKGVFTIVVTIMMLFMAFPVNVQASGTPMLGMRWAYYDNATGTFYEDLSASLITSDDSLSMPIGNSPVFMYFVDENGQETRLDMSQISSSDTNILSFMQDGNTAGVTHLQYRGVGNASINYTYNGTVYSLTISVTLPEIGYYTTTTATSESYISEYTVTDSENIFYLVCKDGVLNNVALNENFSNIATVQMGSNNTYAEITVTGNPQNGWWYEAAVSFTNAYGGVSSWSTGLNLYNGKTSLQLCYSNWNNNVPSMSEYLNTSLYIAKGFGNSMYPFLVSADGKQQISPQNLTSSDESVMTVRVHESYSDIAVIESVDFGTAQLIYTDSAGNVYPLEVTVGLPDVGFYTTTTASQETYLTEFAVTDDGANKFYMVSRNGTMDNIRLGDAFSKIATVQMGSDNTYAEITVNGVPGNQRYSIETDFTNEWGYTNNYGTGLNLINNKSSLQFCYAYWKDDVLVLGNYMNNSMYIAKGFSDFICPYYMSGGNKLLLSADSLTSSDESIVKVKAHEDYSDVVEVESVGFGSTTISYTHSDGKTYSFEVTVGLPDVGFYTTPTASEASYINEYTITDDGDNKFYVVCRNGIFNSISLNDEFNDIATIQMGSDNTYAEITVTGTPNGRGYGIEAEVANIYGNVYSYWESINLINGKPSLQRAGADYDGKEWTPSEYFSTELSIPKGSISYSFMYFVNGDSKQVLTAENLTSSDESIIKITEASENDEMIVIEAIDFGSATISYAHSDGKTYSFEVTVGLPNVGFYTTPTATEESFITKYVVTEDNANQFYLVTRYGTIDYVELRDSLADIATVQIGSDNTYAEITFTGEPNDGWWYNVYVELTNIYGYKDTWDISIELENGKPHIALTWPDVEGTGHGSFSNCLYTAAEFSTDVWVYYIDGETERTLSIEDLKSSDESIIQIEDPGYDDGMVTLKTVGWGEAAISYTYNGETYSINVTSQLQDVGFYAAATRSEENWIRSFTITEDNNTFYFVVADGNVFVDVTLLEDLQNIATVTLNDSKTYAKIVVTGEPKNDGRYGVEYTYAEGNGTFWHGGRNYLDFIQKAQSDGDVDVEVDELPTIDPTTPTDDVVVGVDSSSKEVLESVGTDIITTITNSETANNVSQEVATSIKNALDSGANLKVTTSVVVENLDEDSVQDAATKEDVAAIETAKGEGQVAQYLDLSVVVTTYVNGTQDAEGNVSKLDAPIVFTVALPDDVKTVPEGYERSIYVIYVHDGVVKTIPVTENADGTISFEASEFSTYALAYKDTKTVTPVEAFVTRMYQQCLSRNPDQAGLDGWVGQLEGRYMNGAQIAEQFVFSNEMLQKNLSNGDFVDVLYRAMMGREADADGKSGWVSQLDRGLMSRSQVTKSFVESEEFTKICGNYGIERGTYDASIAPIEKFVTRFYTLCLGRPNPDQAGLYGWVGQLKGQHMNGAQIADSFFFSTEYLNKNVSNDDYVACLYSTLMGRTADAEGKAGWVSQLEGNHMTRKEVMKAFIVSTEFTNICQNYGITRGSL